MGGVWDFDKVILGAFEAAAQRKAETASRISTERMRDQQFDEMRADRMQRHDDAAALLMENRDARQAETNLRMQQHAEAMAYRDAAGLAANHKRDPKLFGEIMSAANEGGQIRFGDYMDLVKQRGEDLKTSMMMSLKQKGENTARSNAAIIAAASQMRPAVGLPTPVAPEEEGFATRAFNALDRVTGGGGARAGLDPRIDQHVKEVAALARKNMGANAPGLEQNIQVSTYIGQLLRDRAAQEIPIDAEAVGGLAAASEALGTYQGQDKSVPGLEGYGDWFSTLVKAHSYDATMKSLFNQMLEDRKNTNDIARDAAKAKLPK